jgi:hypothetical protein
MSEIERPISIPSGSITDITRVRGVMTHRYRETQPQVNQPTQDTIPGIGSGDQ